MLRLSSTIPPRALPTKVVKAELDELLAPVEVEAGYESVLLVVRLMGRVIGQVEVAPDPVLSDDVQRAAILKQLEAPLSEQLLREAFTRATRGSKPGREREVATVSVLVETTRGVEELPRCVESLLGLSTPASEIFVVDHGGGREVEAACEDHGVRYLGPDRETGAPARLRALAQASGELVAFIAADCRVDRRWLDGVSSSFVDPLVMATTGYIGPEQLETEAQSLLVELEGSPRFERTVFYGASNALDLPTASPVRAAARLASHGNVVFRRRLLAEAGLDRHRELAAARPYAFELYALYRLLDAGYRLVFDPSQIVWRRHEPEPRAARRRRYEASADLAAYGALCALRHREPGAVRLWLSLWARHLRDAARGAPSLALAEARGSAAGALGAWRLFRSRSTPKVEPSRPAANAPTEVVAIDPDDPRVSVVIPSFNRREKLGETLRSLARQTYPHDRFEVVVVLDGSTDGSAEFVRSMELPYQLKLVEQPNRGVAASRNRGIREAAHPLIVSLDDDLFPKPEFLAEHARAHRDQDDKLVAIGYCPAAISARRLWERLLRTFWEDHYLRKGEPDHQWTYIDFSVGNVSLSRSLVESAGWFDEHFGPRNDDQEFGVRLVRAGARFTYSPGATALHHFDTSFSTHLRQTRAQAVYDVALARKYPHLRNRVTIGLLTGSKGMSARSLIAYRHPRAAELALRVTLPLVDILDALKLRRHWRRLTRMQSAASYVLGLRDALGTQEALHELVTSISEAPPTVVLPLWLDRSNSLRIPAEGQAPALRIGYAGQPIVDLLAMEPGKEWNWDDLTERLVSGHAQAICAAVPLEDLFRLAGMPGRLGAQPLASASVPQ